MILPMEESNTVQVDKRYMMAEKEFSIEIIRQIMVERITTVELWQ